jgi:rhodanese-related sulfurtransferase
MLKNNILMMILSIFFVTLSLASFASDEKAEKKEKMDCNNCDEKECKSAKITVEELKKAIAEKKVTIVDTNGSESFAKGHIPSALDAKADGFDAKLPADKASLIVLYCGAEKCTGCKDSEKITKLGYTNIKCLADGLKAWTKADGKLEK